MPLGMQHQHQQMQMQMPPQQIQGGNRQGGGSGPKQNGNGNARRSDRHPPAQPQMQMQPLPSHYGAPPLMGQGAYGPYMSSMGQSGGYMPYGMGSMGMVPPPPPPPYHLTGGSFPGMGMAGAGALSDGSGYGGTMGHRVGPGHGSIADRAGEVERQQSEHMRFVESNVVSRLDRQQERRGHHGGGRGSKRAPQGATNRAGVHGDGQPPPFHVY
jgi:hypothetical protein